MQIKRQIVTRNILYFYQEKQRLLQLISISNAKQIYFKIWNATNLGLFPANNLHQKQIPFEFI